MLKSVWKNVIGIVAFFSVIFCIFYFNIKVGFSAFDLTRTTLTPTLLSVTIMFLSIFITVLIVVFVIFIFLYCKKRKNKMEIDE